jgi:hypothetical protein
MDPHIHETLFSLCKFFDVISQNSVSKKQVIMLQDEINMILNELEMYFPPAFFDIMVHLVVYIIHLGPTFLHNMMIFERLNGVMNRYVHNRAHQDGSIV